MKNRTRKFFFAEKIRWLPLFFFSLGLGLQVAGNWLPARVICYKASEKPKIELSFNGCECSHNDNRPALDGFHADSPGLHSGCLDVPLTTDPACISPVRPAAMHRGPGLQTRPGGVTYLSHFQLTGKPEFAYPPPGLEMMGDGLALVPRSGKSASILGRFRC